MAITVTRYLCDICLSIHKNISDAIACEQLEKLPQSHNVGDSITFENESTMFGSRYSYRTMSGIVLLVHWNTCVINERRYHIPVYVVDMDTHEVEVYISNTEFGVKLYSPAEHKYRKGYSLDLAQQIEINKT